MKVLLRLLLDARVERLTRDLLKHARRCCVGAEGECPGWQAISALYDDALARRQQVDA